MRGAGAKRYEAGGDLSYAVEVSAAERGVGEKASVLPQSRKPASSLRAGERRPTRQAGPPPRAPGRELTPLHPLAVPATSLSPARASHWDSAATRIPPAVPPTRMLMFYLFVLRFAGSVFIGGPNFAGTDTDEPLSHRTRSAATASGTKRY